MVWTIARKQLLNNLLTYKFLVGFVLSVVLFSLSALVLTRDYEERLASYNSAVAHHAASLNEAKVYSQVRVTVDRRPSLLSPICEGFEKRFANSAVVSYTEIPTLSVGQGEKNPLMLTLKSIDLAAIIEIVLGLLALLFAYDSFSGERERGVLALTLANHVPRSTVLLGQYLGGILTLLPLLLSGMIVAALIMLTSPVIAFHSSEWLSLGLVTVLSLAYLSALYLIGMFVSIATRASSTSLVVCLFFWVLFVILIPNGSTHLAYGLRPIQAKYVADAEARKLQMEFYLRIGSFANKHPRPAHNFDYIKDRSVFSGDVPYPYLICFAPREVMQWELDGLKYCLPEEIACAENTSALYRNYELSLAGQAGLAAALGRLSPARIYREACATLAGTDSAALIRFFALARDYRRQLMRYVNDKGGFGAAFFTRAEINKLPTTADLDALKASGGKAALDNVIGPGFDSVPPLNLQDLPAWDSSSEFSVDRAGRALPDAGILLFINLLFFLGSHVAFLRADVRVR